MRSLPKDCQVCIQAHVSNLEMNTEPHYVLSRQMDAMRRQLAAMIVHAKLDKDIKEYSTTLRLSLLVFNPDDFYRIVQEEAMRMTTFMHPMSGP